MPKWLICVPLTVQWLWLALIYRSATLPSCANPALTAGGLVGEGKLEYFSGMGAVARAATAPFVGISTAAPLTQDQLAARVAEAGLAFPLIAKPDLGLCGFGVRRVDSLTELAAYVAAFPRDQTVVLQTYLAQEGEAGIFYARDPATGRASITGLALRFFPRVTGDGVRSLKALIEADPRARRLLGSPRHEAPALHEQVPPAGQSVRLATIGSTRVGGLYRDATALVTPRLTAAVDAIARDMPLFYCGRFDVRFERLDELCEGRGFTIIEINGAGSEAIHAWDPRIGLWQGLRMVFAKQRLLFSIGDQLRRAGVRPIGLLALARLNRKQQVLIAQYPPSN